MTPPAPILCLGEILWDVLPTARFLGGAPFNVACHLRALGQPVTFASRVGGDALGHEIRRAVDAHGIPTDLLQVDPALPTGTVLVTFPTPDAPSYDIRRPSAWDAIAPTPALLDAAGRAPALVFGTLAQRDEPSRQAIHEAVGRCTGLVVCDVNLRPPYDDAAIVETSLERADLIKLNEDELSRLTAWFKLPDDPRRATIALASRFAADTVCLTRGHRGAALYHRQHWLEHPGYAVEVSNTVGSGDAFLAALLTGLLADPHLNPASLAATLARANAVGAYVATQPSATPPLDFEKIEQMSR